MTTTIAKIRHNSFWWSATGHHHHLNGGGGGGAGKWSHNPAINLVEHNQEPNPSTHLVGEVKESP
jgi:hypothetical protein